MADDDNFEKATSGASLTKPAQCSSLRKNGFVMIKDKPCRIVDMSTSKTGKHGHAKVHIVGIDIFTNQKYEENSPSTHNIEVPEVKRVEYSVIDINGDFLSLMAEDGSIREDIKFDPKVCNNKIGDTSWSLEMIQELIDEDGEMPLATLVSACGKEFVKEVKAGKKS